MDNLDKGIDYIVNSVAFFFDKTQTLWRRFSMAAVVLAALWFLNDSTGFLYYRSIHRKMENIAHIDNLLQKPTLDSALRRQLLTLENQVLSRQSCLSSFWGAVVSSFMEMTQSLKYSINPNTTTPNAKTSMLLSDFLHVFTSAYGCIFFMIVVLFAPFLVLKDFNWRTIPTFLILEMLFSCLTLFFAYTFSWIPILSFGGYVWNYLINFLLQSVFTVFMCRYILKKL
jgi:hypothetical protein